MTNILASFSGKVIIYFKSTYVLSYINIAWEDAETPKKLTLQVVGVEEEEEERLLSTRLYQNLNLLFLNDQALENQNPQPSFQVNFEKETVEKPADDLRIKQV